MKRLGILSGSLLLVLQLSAGKLIHASNAGSPIGKSCITSFSKRPSGKLAILLFDGSSQLQDLFLSSLHVNPQRNTGPESSVYFNQLAASLTCRKCERYSFGAFLHHRQTQKIIFPFHYFW